MADFASSFVEGAMRAGYSARGVVYGTVGGLALAAASGRGEAQGLLGSIRQYGSLPWDQPLLILVACGLVGYAIWRISDSVLDLGQHGRGFGWVERGGLFCVGWLHVAFAWYALSVAFGGLPVGSEGGSGSGSTAAESGGGGSMASMISKIIQNPFGRWFVVVVGIGAISFGCFSIWKGVSARYHRHLRKSPLLDRLIPIFGFGLVVRGIILAVMGGFIVWGAWTFEPQTTGGYGATLRQIGFAAHGRALLGVAGFGMIAFSAYCFGESAYHRIPNDPGKAMRAFAARIRARFSHRAG